MKSASFWIFLSRRLRLVLVTLMLVAGAKIAAAALEPGPPVPSARLEVPR